MYAELIDQIGENVCLKEKPKRIVSLVPSQTEFLFDLGLDDKVVGITKFCINPEVWFRSKTRIGGTKKVNFEKIKALSPDLIIANKEENLESDIRQLQKKYQVYTSDILDLKDAFKMMTDIGSLTDTTEKTGTIISQISNDFESIPKYDLKVLYLIWKDPYMAAGQHTFITSMLNQCGLKNIDESNLRYDEISKDKIRDLNPDFIFLSSEPYPFKAKHIAEITKFSNAKTILVDGEIFSWYGTRLTHFKTYIKSLKPLLNTNNA